MTNSPSKRIVRLMKERTIYNALLTTCDRMTYIENKAGYERLAKACKLRLNKLDSQIVRIITPLVTEVDTVGEITDSDIARAKDHPIENLFPEHKKYYVNCLFHEDKRPSASIKKGFLYCFTCGRGWDSIEVYRKQTGCSFVDAVKHLR